MYDGSGNAINTTTDLEFDSFGVQTTGTFAANVGDQINIDGTTVEVQASGTNSISVTSNATDETIVDYWAKQLLLMRIHLQ